MAVLKRRSKIVSVRLSEQEYQELLSCCLDRGTRSLSDLAREAMQGLLASRDGNGNGNGHGNGHGNGDGLGLEVEKLHGRMEQLDHELKRLASLVNKAAAAAGGTL
jgi:hypothetical protein